MTERITCTTCKHFTRTHCQRAKAAGLFAPNGRAEIGPALAKLPQWCHAGERK